MSAVWTKGFVVMMIGSIAAAGVDSPRTMAFYDISTPVAAEPVGGAVAEFSELLDRVMGSGQWNLQAALEQLKLEAERTLLRRNYSTEQLEDTEIALDEVEEAANLILFEGMGASIVQSNISADSAFALLN